MAAQAPSELPRMERISAYSDYQKAEGIRVYRGFSIEDLNALDLDVWPRMGARGAFVNLEGTGGTNDAYVCELPPGQSTSPQRHLFEAMVYVLSGRGATSVWHDDKQKVSFEWQPGSLFAIPLNASYQHFNGSGAESARFFVVTNAPVVMDLFHNLSFVFENPFVFPDRFGGQDDYFSGEAKKYAENCLETNFIADTGTLELDSRPARGAGGRVTAIELANNTMCAHISEFPVGTYKKAHRHGPGAHVIILSGEGFSYLWPEGTEKKRVDWHRGSVVVPPDRWFHQHFNGGTIPARYLALRWGSRRYQTSGALQSETRPTSTSLKEGGDQIEYQDEEPQVHRMFEETLTRAGARCQMRSLISSCTGD